MISLRESELGIMAIKLGSIYGIPLFLDYSWFVILVLIIYTVGFAVMPAQYPGLSLYTYFVLGLLSALLLFISIVVHELAHSIIAKRNGLKIAKITLYLLGGVSEMTEQPPSSSLELRMSAAGPLTSLAIAGISFLGFYVSLQLGLSIIIQGPLEYTWLFNLIIAGFNLIPAFPMDGGRVLRAMIWKFSGDMIKSTKIASTVGRIFAYGMMLIGVFISFISRGLIFDGLWLVVLGWFISSGAQSEYNQILIQRDMADMKARDIMTRDYPKVSSDLFLYDALPLLSKDKQYALPVVNGDQLMGCVTLKDARNAMKRGKDQFSTPRVSEVMILRERLATVKESDSARQVMSLIGNTPTGTVFVFSDEDNARLAGAITKADIIKSIQMQESYRRSAPAELPYGSERNIAVELGMLFQLNAPQEAWTDSYASFDPNEFTLISEQIIQLAPDRQTRQFTLQALRKGTCYIHLLSRSGKKDSLRYTILVS